MLGCAEVRVHDIEVDDRHPAALLREVDGDFKTPASDNMVYQNFPAIVFGFPLMFLATLAPTKPVLTLIAVSVFFVVLNVILFRSFIFKKRKK